MEKFEHEYKADQIQVLEGLEAVRKRPGMYIGSVSVRGLHHLVYEIVDNSVDEALAGYCRNINVVIEKGNIIRVEDDGRGIPVDIHPKTKISAAETVYTVLHAGGKFGGDSGYKVSGGLHGVGAAVVNALSEWLEVEVHQNGNIYRQRFEYAFDKELGKDMPGTAVTPLEIVGKSKDTGTRVTFKPSKEIFSTTDFKFDVIDERLKELSFQNKGIYLELIDRRKDEEVKYEYYSENGLLDFIKYLNESKTPIHQNPIIFEGERNVGLYS